MARRTYIRSGYMEESDIAQDIVVRSFKTHNMYVDESVLSHVRQNQKTHGHVISYPIKLWTAMRKLSEDMPEIYDILKPSGDVDQISSDTNAALYAAIDSLSPEKKKAVMGHFFDGTAQPAGLLESALAELRWKIG